MRVHRHAESNSTNSDLRLWQIVSVDQSFELLAAARSFASAWAFLSKAAALRSVAWASASVSAVPMAVSPFFKALS